MHFLTHKSKLKIKFVLITSKGIDVDRIGFEKCIKSNGFRSEFMYPTDVAGIAIVIDECHILPFTVKKVEEAMQMLHHNFNENVNARGLYDQNQKKNTKFDYTCAEIFFKGYHEAQLKNKTLDKSKVRA